MSSGESENSHSHRSHHSKRISSSSHSRIPQFKGGKRSPEPKTIDDAKRPTFFQKQWYIMRQTMTTSGSQYNLIVPTIIGFIGTAIILLTIRPFFVKAAPPSPKDMRMPDWEHEFDEPKKVSLSSVLTWSALAAGGVGLLTFFTRPKPQTEYRVV